jgi:type II secretory pathway pseudopilin PulG
MDSSGSTKVFDSPTGATLLEVVIAVTCLAIALMGLLSLWSTSERQAALAREEAIAQAAVNQIISDVRASPFHLIPFHDPASDPNANNPGFSSGYYDGTGASQRLLPKYFFSSQGWDAASPVKIAIDTLPSGVVVSQTHFPGSIPMAGRYYGPSGKSPQLRVILINDECPVESELGETAGDSDGFDLDRNGLIATTPVPAAPFPATPVDASAILGKHVDGTPVKVTPLFPRLLAGSVHAPTHAYLNISQLQVLPVAVQIRWWSKAGIPREITVVTVVTNRNGIAGQ